MACAAPLWVIRTTGQNMVRADHWRIDGNSWSGSRIRLTKGFSTERASTAPDGKGIGLAILCARSKHLGMTGNPRTSHYLCGRNFLIPDIRNRWKTPTLGRLGSSATCAKAVIGRGKKNRDYFRLLADFFCEASITIISEARSPLSIRSFPIFRIFVNFASRSP